MDKNYAEAIASLKEMVSIYGEEGARGGVLVPYEEQPTCIRRAMDAIRVYEQRKDQPL
jgi:hypothetical protein